MTSIDEMVRTIHYRKLAKPRTFETWVRRNRPNCYRKFANYVLYFKTLARTPKEHIMHTTGKCFSLSTASKSRTNFATQQMQVHDPGHAKQVFFGWTKENL